MASPCMALQSAAMHSNPRRWLISKDINDDTS
jgi:hypothetical protein